jgi:hypothetical protein
MFVSCHITTVFINDVGLALRGVTRVSGLSLYVMSSRNEWTSKLFNLLCLGGQFF